MNAINSFFTAHKRLIIAGLIVILLIFGATRVFGQKQQAPTYQTSQAAKGTLISSISTSGTVSSGNSINITSGATGVVNNVYVKNGDTVYMGQKIADITLDQDSQQKQTAAWSSYLQAKNSLASAQAKLNSLQSTLFSTNQKLINDAVARNLATDDPTYIQENANWLQAQADYQNQGGVISQAQAALSSSWLSYQQTSSVITAPSSGTIDNLTITPGLVITSSSSNSSSNSTSLNTLGVVKSSNSQLQANVNLSEIDVVKVKPGQKVTMTLDAYPDKTFTGKVMVVNTNGQVSSNVTTYPTTIQFDLADKGIYPNMAVTAQIITNVKDNVILVPSAAVQTNNGQSTVRVLKNGQISTVNVQVGDSNDTQTEIVSGINDGDMVVTSQSSSNSSTTSTTSPFSSLGGGNRGFGGGGTVRVLTR